jgi:polysaccharide biosynthesis protein PslH
VIRILILSPRQCWPPQSGAKLRDYYFARTLGQHASVDYVYYIDPGSAPLSIAELPFCRNIVGLAKPRAYTPVKIARGLIGCWPLPVLNYTSQEMLQAVDCLARSERYDLVHLDSIHMTGYVDVLRAALGTDVPIVYNWHNIESELMRRYSAGVNTPARRIYSAWTARQLERLERSILQSSFGHVVCSEREREQLHRMEPAARIAVVPNGVDTAYFADGGSPGTRHRIVFVGAMRYPPNIEAAVTFVHNVWPHLRDHLPGYTLTLVGANPVPAVTALRDIAGVEVTGTVPDVRPYYREALAAIVPLRTGGGTRLKILEAMAAGVPVVSTALGAEGLSVAPGKNILLADVDDSESWLRALAGLAESEERPRELTSAGLQLVRDSYDWTSLGESLCRIYADWLEKVE